MASTELESNKTCVLRVSVHCEGCKRKVRKIIQSLPGVRDVEIETRLQRAVVTGDVSPETLVKKLVKAGKHAELWPEKADRQPRNFNPPENGNNNQKIQKAPSNTSEESAVPGKGAIPPANKTGVPVQETSKNSCKSDAGDGAPVGAGGKVDEGVGKSEVAGSGKAAVEVKVEEMKPDTGSAGNQGSQPVVEKTPEEQTEKSSGDINGGAGGGEAKKKKKKKGQNGNNRSIGETSSAATPLGSGGGIPPPTTVPTNQIHPRHHGYQYPPPHDYSPALGPVYAVSYNTAHPPANSYTASYHAAPPPHSYAYSHSGSEMHPPPLDFDSYTQQPLDSFEMFSDENPNGCLVM